MKHVLRVLLVIFPLLMWSIHKIIDSTIGTTQGEVTSFVFITIFGIITILYLENERYNE